MTALILQVSYLTGRSVASTYNDRERAEWPVHPARLYSALVATWAETDRPDPAERTALEWLAALDAPSIYASDASHRQVVPHFVPVNDVAVLDGYERQRAKQAEVAAALTEAKVAHERALSGGDKKAIDKAAKAVAREEKKLQSGRRKLEVLLLADQQAYEPGRQPNTGVLNAAALIPERRGKQPRTFPSVSPADPIVFVRWEAEPSELDEHKPALAQLASRVVRVGHSASLVSCRVAEACPTPTWEPNDEGDEVLRVPGPDQFSQLRESFERHKEVEPRVLPCRFQRYRRAGGEAHQDAVATSCFSDDWIVFRQIRGRRLAPQSCVSAARAMRGALMKHVGAQAPSLLSGHSDDGKPLERPHLAIVPLPFVGHEHATGELLGVALVFPRTGDEAERNAILRAIGSWESEQRLIDDDELVDTPPLELVMGRAGAIEVERIEWGLAPLKTLRPPSWCRASHSWVTATPIALDRNPGDLSSRDPNQARAAYEAAEQSIALACERIGLPAPSYVQVHPSVPLHGAYKARTYPAFPTDPKKNQRVKVHARIEFPVRVSGPILLGAGRYYGLGLCFPQPTEPRAQT